MSEKHDQMQSALEAFDREALGLQLRAEVQRLPEVWRRELGAEKEEELIRYLLFMLEKNQVMNLTGITDPAEVMQLHAGDSLTLLPLLDAEKKSGRALKFLDLGSGAGFPAFPVKIARPELDLLMLDALGKRVRFLEEAAALTPLHKPWQALHARAEEAGRQPELREQFDVVTARAVAELRVLAELCLPFVRKGGVFIAMKAECGEEIKAAEKALSLLGAKLEETSVFKLPGSEITRSLIVIRKTAPCAKRYPRPFAQIKKNPL